MRIEEQWGKPVRAICRKRTLLRTSCQRAERIRGGGVALVQGRERIDACHPFLCRDGQLDLGLLRRRRRARPAARARGNTLRLGEEGDRANLDGRLVPAPQEREMRVLVDRIGGVLLEILLRDEAVLRLLQLEQPLVLELLRASLDLPPQ